MSLGHELLTPNLTREQSQYSELPLNSLGSWSDADSLEDRELVVCTCKVKVGRRKSANLTESARDVDQRDEFDECFSLSYVRPPAPWPTYDVVSITSVLPVLVYVAVCVLSFSHGCFASALPSSEGSPYGTAPAPSSSSSRGVGCPLLCECVAAASSLHSQPILRHSNPSLRHSNPKTSVVVNVTCANKNLTEVPDLRSGNMDIKVLNFSGNALVGMFSQSFRGLQDLRVLDLSSNHISKVDEAAFWSLDNITHLYLSHNNLSSLYSNTFQNLLSLVHLDLSHNSLSSLPQGLFQNTPALLRLDLQHNKLLSISVSSFSGSSSMPAILDISHNPDLEMGSGVLSSFVHLEDLNLANTGLVDARSVIEFLSLDTFPRLSHLNLSSNGLTFLNASHLDILFEKVGILDLSRNLFQCDCSVLPMVQWLHKSVHRMTQVTHDWILPVCHSPETLKDKSVSSITLSQLKITCSLLAKCNVLNPASTRRECLNITLSTEKSALQVVYMTATQPMNTTRLIYESMLLPYDPMLGWYTAAALGGMVGVLLLCLIFERVKQKIEQYRRRRWRRKCRKMWEAARAAAGEDGGMEDSGFPLQTQTPVFYSNEIQGDALRNSNAGEEAQDTKANAVLAQENSTATLTIQTGTDPGAGSRPPSRRLSVSWGPTSDMSDVTPTSPCIMPNHSASTLTDLNNPTKTSNNRTKPATTAATADAAQPANQVCKKTSNRERSKCSPPQSLLRALDQASQEIQVSQVHPGCPIHNPHRLNKLKALLKRNPDKSLQELLRDNA